MTAEPKIITLTPEQLLREAADDCEAHANDILREAPNMGPTKERHYRREASEVMARVVALRGWADELSAAHDVQAERRISCSRCVRADGCAEGECRYGEQL